MASYENIPSVPKGPQPESRNSRGLKGIFHKSTEWSRSKYKSLSTSNNEIRLLRLAAGKRADPISCSFSQISLNSPPSYGALSYTWGSKDNPQVIFLDGLRLPVTYNLHSALVVLRSPNFDRILWADAVCINQENTTERNHQVTKMGSIYKMATKVIIWLGESRENSSLAFSFIRELNVTPPHDVSWLESVVRKSALRSSFAAVDDLFKREYWTRIWVIQEALSAKDMVVFCGEDFTKWSYLDSLRTILEPHWNTISATFGGYGFTNIRGSGPFELRVRRSIDPPGTIMSVEDMLVFHRTKKATDPRDKVIGLVGLHPQLQNQGLINYNRTVKETFMETFKVIVRQTNSLDVISAVGTSPNPHSLPSWTPDWSQHNPDFPINYVTGFRATGDTEPRMKFKGNCMTVRGSNMGYIKKLGSICRAGGPNLTDLGAMAAAFDNWLELLLEANKNDRNLAMMRLVHAVFYHPYFASIRESEDWPVMAAVYHLDIETLCSAFRATPEERMEILATLREPEVFDDIGLFLHCRRLFIDDHGIVGLARKTAVVGDLVVFLFGCSFPLLLRISGEKLFVIGEVWVDEMMDGEALKLIDEELLDVNDFDIY